MERLFLLLIWVTLAFSSSNSLAAWSDEAVSLIESETGSLNGGEQDGALSPDKLLPLAEQNSWEYRFIDRFSGSGVLEKQLVAESGVPEKVGRLCLSPLVFGADKQLELYLANHNERLVFYGFRGVLDGKQQSFFFSKSADLGFDGGIDLASADPDHDLLAEQSGKHEIEVNGEDIQVAWVARNKSVETSVNSQTFTGSVAGLEQTLTPDTRYVFDFDLFVSPCASGPDCYLGSFVFEFLPGIGLYLFELVGDNELFGGQFSQEYYLEPSPAVVFSIAQQVNSQPYFTCSDIGVERRIRESGVGWVSIWFNIFLIIVVVLGHKRLWNLTFQSAQRCYYQCLKNIIKTESY